MRRIFIFLSLLCVVSCAHIEAGKDSASDSMELHERRTRSMDGSSQYSLSTKDIEAYLHFKQLQNADNPAFEVKSVIPFPEENEPALYIINYDDGWEIVASDKRIPTPLAECPNGTFELNTNNPTLPWIESMAERVCITKNSDELSDIATYSINLWSAITCHPTIIATRSETDAGHYELDAIYRDTEVCDSIKHLTTTNWNQSLNNNNYYIPLKSNSSTDRAPAGCVAVAGAQLLYFLHNAIGTPQSAPDSAFCYGNVNGYQMWQGNFSPYAWNNMSDSGNYASAKLIAHVATFVRTNFGDDGSYASTADLVDLFNYYGITCSEYVSFDHSIVKSSLTNGMPVIVRAEGHSNILDLYDGHSFIIDGFVRERTQTTYVYRWVWDNYDPTGDYGFVDDSISVIYSSPYVTKYYMNWGWAGSYNNSSFIPEGDWMPFVGENYNFIYRRKMIYGFTNN